MIEYSDGIEVEREILALIRAAPEIGSQAHPAFGQYHRWPIRYHLSPERANLVRHLAWEGLEVLEVGAGMGAVSRSIAERCARLHVVEGTVARYEVLAERLRDLSNWSGEVANFQDCAPDPRYDVVCLFGVLEYAELYFTSEDGLSPHETMARHAKRFLRPGGVLLVAIENRLGAKYFQGCAEDHVGLPFAGVCDYDLAPTPRTFDLQGLRAVLARAGFAEARAQYPFPDYKVPAAVLDEAFVRESPGLAAQIAAGLTPEDYSGRIARAFPYDLFVESLGSRPELLAEFANSFLTLATEDASSETLVRLLAGGQGCAWHYTRFRKRPVRTEFRPERGGVKVTKHPGGTQERWTHEDEAMRVRWQSPEPELATEGPRVSQRLRRIAAFGDRERFEAELVAFLREIERVDAEEEGALDGRALDAIPTNAIQTSEGIRRFDEEWIIEAPMPKSWHLLRSLLALRLDSVAPASWGSVEKMYEALCARLGLTAEFERDAAFESRFQILVNVLRAETPEADYRWHARDLLIDLRRSFEGCLFERAERDRAEAARLRGMLASGWHRRVELLARVKRRLLGR